MRVLVLGGNGMLGHQVARFLSSEAETWVTIRRADARLEGLGIPESRQLTNVELGEGRLREVLDAVLAQVSPDVIVNAVGAIKPTSGPLDASRAISLNSLLPRMLGKLAEAYQARVVTIGTDCVFNGTKGHYQESEAPDADDLYGRTKALGELPPPHLTLRTSIVGRELSGDRGLVEWFLGNRGGVVAGYANAVFSGLPTVVLAQTICRMLTAGPHLEGLYHVAAAPIDKLSLLRLLNDSFEAKVLIDPKASPCLDRSLDGSRFNEAVGFSPESWPELVQQMVMDSHVLHYDHLRALGGGNKP